MLDSPPVNGAERCAVSAPPPVSACTAAHSDPDQRSRLRWNSGQWTSAGTSESEEAQKGATVKTQLFMLRKGFVCKWLHLRFHTWNFSLQVPTLTSVPQITSLWLAFGSLAVAPSALGCKSSPEMSTAEAILSSCQCVLCDILLCLQPPCILVYWNLADIFILWKYRKMDLLSI